VATQLGNRRLAILSREHVITLETPLELAQEAWVVFDDQ
jgi:hypothetical protein